METTLAEPSRSSRNGALLWAAGVSLLGALGIGALSLALWVAAQIAVAVAEVFRPELQTSADEGWVIAVTVTAMLLCLASGVGAAWVVIGSPPGALPPTLVGIAAGVFGWAVGLCAFCLPMGIDPLSLFG
jgi:hypothetical protein